MAPNPEFNEGVSPKPKEGVSQDPEEVGDGLASLSEKIQLCNILLKDLKDLSAILKKKSLQEVSVPSQE